MSLNAAYVGSSLGLAPETYILWYKKQIRVVLVHFSANQKDILCGEEIRDQFIFTTHTRNKTNRGSAGYWKRITDIPTPVCYKHTICLSS